MQVFLYFQLLLYTKFFSISNVNPGTGSGVFLSPSFVVLYSCYNQSLFIPFFSSSPYSLQIISNFLILSPSTCSDLTRWVEEEDTETSSGNHPWWVKQTQRSNLFLFDLLSNSVNWLILICIYAALLRSQTLNTDFVIFGCSF